VTLLDIAFLKNVGAFWIALTCMVPAFVFIAYVVFDDARQARAHRKEEAQAGSTHH
jgi:hypothetical protein